MKVLECGTLIDGIADEPLTNARIVVDDGEFVEVGRRESVSAPNNAEVIDHSGQIVMPGMIDAHVHIAGWRSMDPNDWVMQNVAQGAARATADLRRLVAAGFTTVRDVGGRTGIGLRDAVAEGEIPGPRIFTSELGLSQTAGHEDVHYMPYEWVRDDGTHLAVLADGVDECRKETRKQIRKGVDLIKIQTTGGIMSEKDEPDQPQYTAEEISAITTEAHRVGIPVAAHAQHSSGVSLAVENGVDTIEHGIILNEESIDLMLETDATFVPTLWAVRQSAERGAEFGVPEHSLRKAREASEYHLDSVKKAYDAGVPIAMGTDNVGAEPLGPHGVNAEEAILYVEEVGLSEMDAIKSTTSVAARTVPADNIGSIEAGNIADLVVLKENPLEDITALTSIDAVYKGGDQVSV